MLEDFAVGDVVVIERTPALDMWLPVGWMNSHMHTVIGKYLIITHKYPGSVLLSDDSAYEYDPRWLTHAR